MKTENRYATTGFGTGNTIDLNMTGSRNPFIFAIRKYESANFLFPEYREKMKSLTVKN